MGSMRKALFLVVAAFVGATNARAEDLKIGVIAALTGPGAPWGKACKVGAQLAANEVNARGGLEVGGKKYTVKIVAYDDKYIANDAVAAYNRLTRQDGVKFIVMFASPSTMALRQMIENDDVLAITAAQTKKALEPTTKHMFRYLSTSPVYVPAVVSWMHDNLSARRVVVVNPNDDTGWDQTAFSECTYKAKGFEVLGHELFERSQLDFTPLLTKVLAMKPDLIDMSGASPVHSGLLVRQSRELGYQGRFAKLSGPCPKDIVKAAGAKASDGTIHALNGDPNSPAYKKLIADYGAIEGHEPNDTIVFFTDGPRILLRAIEKAGTVNDVNKVAAAFSKALPMTSVLGDQLELGGKATYGVDAEVMNPIYIGESRDGGIVIRGKIQPHG